MSSIHSTSRITAKLLTVVLLVCLSPVYAKLILQEARTRHLCQDMQLQMVPIADVRVKVETEERSDARGHVMLKISDNDRGTFCFRELRKAGYTLISPTEEEVQAQRHFPLNKQTAVDIILADKLSLEKHKEQIASLYQSNYESRIRAIELQLEQEVDKTRRAALSEQLHKMYDQYETIVERINEEADKLSRIDYLSLDANSRKSVELRKQGKANELIELNLSLLPDDHEAQAQAVSEVLKQGQDQLAEKKALASYWAQLYHNVAYGHQMKFNYREVARWLEKCCELDADNYAYKIEYAHLLSDYLANHSKALELYLQALPIAKAQTGDQSGQVADIYASMSECYIKLSNPEEARACIDQAQQITEALSTYEHPFGRVVYHNNLAGVYFAQGDYEQALEYYFQAVAPFEIHLGATHPSVLSCYHNIIVTYIALGEYKRALHYGEKLDGLYGKQKPKKNLSIASNYICIALIERKLKNYTAALDYLHKAESLYKQNATNHPARTIALYHMAKNYERQGDVHKAREHYLMANEQFDSLTAHQHHEGIEIAFDLGGLYSRAGEYDKALSLYLSKLSQCRHVLGKNHLTTAILHHRTAQAYLKVANQAQALRHYKQSLDILDECYSDAHLTTASCLMDMGQLCTQMKLDDEALRYFYRALVVRFIAAPKDEHLMAVSHHAIAAVYLRQKKYDKALVAQGKALAHAQRARGEKHAFSLDCSITLGLIHYAQGEYEEARRVYSHALTLSPPKPQLAKIYRLLGLVYQRQANHQQALLHFEQALEIYAKLGDDAQDEMVLTRYNIGKTHLLMGDQSLAQQHLSQAYEEACTLLGEHAATTLIIKQCLDQTSPPHRP